MEAAIEQIKGHIANDRMIEAFAAMDSLKQLLPKDDQNSLLLLKGKERKISRLRTNGEISLDQYLQQQNSIKSKLLEMLTHVELANATSPKVEVSNNVHVNMPKVETAVPVVTPSGVSKGVVAVVGVVACLVGMLIGYWATGSRVDDSGGQIVFEEELNEKQKEVELLQTDNNNLQITVDSLQRMTGKQHLALVKDEVLFFFFEKHPNQDWKITGYNRLRTTLKRPQYTDAVLSEMAQEYKHLFEGDVKMTDEKDPIGLKIRNDVSVLDLKLKDLTSDL